MAKLFTTTAMGFVLALTATPAAAQDLTPEESRAMLERLEALEAETAALRARLTAAEAQAAQATAAADAATSEAAVAATTATAASEAAAKTPAISSFKKSDGWSLKPRGRLQFDMGSVGAPDGLSGDFGNATEVRRARLGVSGDIPGDFGYKFELDFADNEVAFTDAFIDYDGGDVGVVLGQHNNFQSLEEITSSNDISFMERAAFTDAFGFERRLGISANGNAGDLYVWGGLFGSNIGDLGEDGAQAYSLDARAVYAPMIGDTQLHLGGSVHWRDLDDDSESVRYRQRPFIHIPDTRLINTGSLGATSEMSYGLEAAALMGRFHTAGEVHWMRPDLIAGDNPTFFGGYAEVGYMLTPGYARSYSPGAFKSVKPTTDAGWNGLGAVQAVLRYDRLDLSDEAVIGGTQDAIAAALSWHPNAYLRFLVNYAHITYEDAAPAADGDTDYAADVIGARAQFAF
ncbi:OprO/OprP family phosphate-selective porin [Sphingomicrobium arenosum]|uniref:OprO/OprP family phosphate-selective porin n=1 Tax=Sphingomicrobium arenosum TaxID=2233861 RepID=UPI002240FFFA|nr:porin [Sphingomicrobium arenosum]